MDATVELRERAVALYRDLASAPVSRGDAAPGFELVRLDVDSGTAAGVVRLADLVAERPVALLFGSRSCPYFRRGYPQVEALWRAFGDRVAFAVVYVREAHPAGSRQPKANVKEGLLLDDAADFEGRLRAARDCSFALGVRLPLLVDGMDDRTARAYGAWPTRPYVIDRQGRVAFRGQHGPEGPIPGTRRINLDLTGFRRAIRRQAGRRWLAL